MKLAVVPERGLLIRIGRLDNDGHADHPGEQPDQGQD
jgi:hypothetical protein